MSIKQRIIDDIKWVKDNMGYTLVSEDWGNANQKCTCAMGCVLLKDDPKDTVRPESDENASSAAHILEVSENWVNSFIEGFDGVGSADQSKDADAWRMGVEVAEVTQPTVFTELDEDEDEDEDD